MYRSPAREYLEQFSECLEELLEETILENKFVIIAGDLNVELNSIA